MQSGIFLGLSQNGELKIESFGKRLNLKFKKVFAAVGVAPAFTPQFSYWWNQTRFAPTRRLIAFLDEGAELFAPNSLPKGVLLKLNQHLHRYVEWNAEAAQTPPSFIGTVLRTGKSGCQSLAVLYAAMLAEAGYNPRFVVLIPPGESGHVWLEVEIGASQKTFIVDPSNSYIESYSEVAERAQAMSSVEHRWYLNPARIYYGVNEK